MMEGDNQNRTGDKGVADPCLTSWPCRHKYHFFVIIYLQRKLQYKLPELGSNQQPFG